MMPKRHQVGTRHQVNRHHKLTTALPPALAAWAHLLRHRTDDDVIECSCGASSGRLPAPEDRETWKTSHLQAVKDSA